MVSSNASLTLEAFKSATDVTQIEQALIAALEQIQASPLTATLNRMLTLALSRKPFCLVSHSLRHGQVELIAYALFA